MKHRVLIILLSFLLSGPAYAEGDLQKKVTLSFKNTDVVEALQAVAREIGRTPYIVQTVQGTVSIEIVDLPAEEAFRQILATQETKHAVGLKGRQSLIVATPEDLAHVCQDPWVPRAYTIGPVRIECLLKEASFATIINLLEDEFPNVEFSPHPQANGFFARGSKEDLLKIKAELPDLDRAR